MCGPDTRSVLHTLGDSSLRNCERWFSCSFTFLLRRQSPISRRRNIEITIDRPQPLAKQGCGGKNSKGYANAGVDDNSKQFMKHHTLAGS